MYTLFQNFTLYIYTQVADGEFAWISFNSSPTRQNGSHFSDDIFKCISLNGDTWIVNNIWL